MRLTLIQCRAKGVLITPVHMTKIFMEHVISLFSNCSAILETSREPSCNRWRKPEYQAKTTAYLPKVTCNLLTCPGWASNLDRGERHCSCVITKNGKIKRIMSVCVCVRVIRVNPSNAEATFVHSTRTQSSFENHLNLSCWYSLDSSRWVLWDECPCVSTIFQLFAWFCIGQISQQKHKG